MRRLVQVRFTKYDGSLHWNFATEELGRDEHGWWLGVREGERLRRGDEIDMAAPCDFVMLVPADARWTACFNTAGESEIYCDLTTVPDCSDDVVSMVDLDLDVIRRRSDGSVFLDDEDEFADHTARYGYPADLVEATMQAAVDLIAAVTARAEPFGTAADRWVEALRTAATA